MDTKSKNLINNYCTTLFRMGIPSLLPKSTGTGKSFRLCMWKIPKGSNLGEFQLAAEALNRCKPNENAILKAQTIVKLMKIVL